MYTIVLIMFLSFTAVVLAPCPVYAVPSLIPYIPIIGAVIIKASTVIGSIIFFALSLIKKNKTIFTLFGFIMFVLSIFLMVYYH